MGAETRGVAEARIHLASAVSTRTGSTPTATASSTLSTPPRGRCGPGAWRATTRWTLSETPVAADPAASATLLAEAWLARGPQGDDAELLRRLRFAGLDLDLPALVARTAADRPPPR